jgi:hypothetical protein
MRTYVSRPHRLIDLLLIESRFSVDDETVCIAVPSLSGPGLEWKTPAQCVWDDEEFSQNEIELESKLAIRPILEDHMPTAKAFFTNVLKLSNAGIVELLDDLKLMQREERDDPRRVYRLYERIESCRRHYSYQIKHVSNPITYELANGFDSIAFKENPIVFIRGINNQPGRWVSLKDCIWTRSVLRSKHALMPSLNQYRDLFRDTLKVQNATVDMLITDLPDSSSIGLPMRDMDGYQYVKELLQEIARLRPNNTTLGRLQGKFCWPCSTQTFPQSLMRMGQFYVNDRQNLFEIFSRTHPFLDFDFETSRKLEDMLRRCGCDSFLSDNILIKTESCGPLQYDHNMTQNLRGRTNALVKYVYYNLAERGRFDCLRK